MSDISPYGQMRLPQCVQDILGACGMETLAQQPRSELAWALDVGQVFALVYTRGNRITFQRAQLSHFSLTGVSLVTGYDAEDITQQHIDCLFAKHPEYARRANRFASQLLKLWSALWRVHTRGLRNALILEDDAIVHPARLPSVQAALTNLPANFDVLHLSGFNPAGRDYRTRCGLLRKAPMDENRAGVGNIISAVGAHRLLRTVLSSNATGVDEVFSNGSNKSVADLISFVLKPYPFTPGAFGSDSLFPCRFNTSCEEEFFARWGQPRQGRFSTWISQLKMRAARVQAQMPVARKAKNQQVQHGQLPTSWQQPAGFGCPELLDCSSEHRQGIMGDYAGNGVGILFQPNHPSRCLISLTLPAADVSTSAGGLLGKHWAASAGGLLGKHWAVEVHGLNRERTQANRVRLFALDSQEASFGTPRQLCESQACRLVPLSRS
mmetsp:Transcript_35282/g.92588  ORF Transcript_35282/g.92588 Transcript_35282/m.92588 type:complete len:438 (+) Transcript_35282:19-1332(+)